MSEASFVRACELNASAEEVEGASGRGTRPEPRVTRPNFVPSYTATVVRDDELSTDLQVLPIPELRSGTWTRFGSDSVLGDAVTEQAFNELAENARQAARSQGYAVGWAEGQRAARAAAEIEAEVAEQARLIAEAQRATEHAEVLASLELAATELRDAVADSCAKIERQATHLAWELVRGIVGHERGSLDAVRRALALAPDTDLATLRLHPRDAEIARVHADLLAARGITVAGDAELGRGDALVEAGDSITDLRIDAALDRVRAALGEDA